MAIDLNRPAFGKGAQTLEELKATITPDTAVAASEVKEEVEQESEETSVEENKVSYSRFKNVNAARREAEAEAERWRQKAEELESSRSREVDERSDEMPSYWTKLYGDSEASKEAWKIQQRREELIEQRAYEAGQRGAQELRRLENDRINENVSVIDESFEELSAFIGRDLTEKEQSAILDIVDDYTAKDDEGNYLGAVMPFEKAWEVYEMKNASSTSKTRQSRDNVASLTGTNTQGDTSVNTEKDKNFNPLDWNAYKKYI
jgi:hypothetical protein